MDDYEDLSAQIEEMTQRLLKEYDQNDGQDRD